MSQIKRTTTSLITLVLIILAFIIFIVYPLFEGVKKESADLFSQKNMLATLEIKIKNLQRFQITYQNYQSNLEKINELFINPAEPINFIEFLEKEAAQSQLFIEIAPLASEKVKGDVWPSMNFQLVLAGSVPGFLQFFEKLEASPYLAEAINLNIRRLNDSDIKSEKFKGFSVGDVNVSFLIKAYSQAL